MCVCVQAILGCREAEKTGWCCCCAAGVERPRELSPAHRIAAQGPPRLPESPVRPPRARHDQSLRGLCFGPARPLRLLASGGIYFDQVHHYS